MKKYFTILTVLLVAALFTAVNVSAYDYIYGGVRPDDSFYFTTRGGVSGSSDYTIGQYITGVQGVVAGDVIELDVNISGIMPEYDGILGAYWDLLYTNNLLDTSTAITYAGNSINSGWSDWAFFNNPDNNIWIDYGYAMYDDLEAGRVGDVALMQINMTADDSFAPLLSEADGAVDLVWHWSAGVGGDIVNTDMSMLNVIENPDTYKYAHHALSDLGDCRLLVNPVPIPGAIWLLGSAFLGILGINRKRGKKH